MKRIAKIIGTWALRHVYLWEGIVLGKKRAGLPCAGPPECLVWNIISQISYLEAAFT